VRGFLRKDEPLPHIVQALDQLADGLLVVDPAVLRPEVDRSSTPLLAALTVREQEVLERMVHGESGQAMATAMDVSYSTMRTHVQNILSKLGVHSSSRRLPSPWSTASCSRGPAERGCPPDAGP
jgi:two-component system nitrate/nitrite response regulator NarL